MNKKGAPSVEDKEVFVHVIKGNYFNSRIQVSQTCDKGATPLLPTNL
jgi:hypothetical protein